MAQTYQEMKSTVLTIAAILLFSFSISIANELEALSDSHEREKARILAPVELKYDRALSELLQKLTKAGRLEEAIAVKNLIEDRSNGADGDWLRTEDTKWKWGSGGQLTLQKNRRALHSKWRGPGKWTRVSEDTVELIGFGDRKFTLKFRDKTSAAVIGPDGATTLITRLEE